MRRDLHFHLPAAGPVLVPHDYTDHDGVGSGRSSLVPGPMLTVIVADLEGFYPPKSR